MKTTTPPSLVALLEAAAEGELPAEIRMDRLRIALRTADPERVRRLARQARAAGVGSRRPPAPTPCARCRTGLSTPMLPLDALRVCGSWPAAREAIARQLSTQRADMDPAAVKRAEKALSALARPFNVDDRGWVGYGPRDGDRQRLEELGLSSRYARLSLEDVAQLREWGFTVYDAREPVAGSAV